MYINFPKDRYEVHVAGFVFVDERLLIAKRAPTKKHWANLWECGGGKVEMFEDLENAVIREYKEEFGIDVEPVKLLGVLAGYNHVIGKNFILFRYLLKPVGDISIDISSEHTEYKFINKNEINDYDFIPGLGDTIKVVFNGLRYKPS